LSLILNGGAGETNQQYMLQFLNYTVSCALGVNQSLTIPLHPPVVLVGSLGLASSWDQRKMNTADQEAVSACLAARVNYFGVHVEISIRGKSLDPPSADEITEYHLQEGAFWGNIFADHPQMFACANETNLQNSYLSLRFCSTGFPIPDESTISCGPIRHVGTCDSVCQVDPARPDQYKVCLGSQQVLSVFLPPINN
jgi:hypothetical protein